jgi:RNA polymerase sigma-70 factor (ECF subfamily)
MSASPKLRLVPDRAVEVDPSSSDAELLEAARAKHTRAWALIYGRHCQRVHRYLCYLVRDAGAAEDLTQETFARAVTAIHRFRGDASVGTWLDRIALNVAREHWRTQRASRALRDQLLELGPPATQISKNAPQIERLQARVLYAVIDQLPESLREAFILRDLMGLDMTEIAASLGLTKSNAAVRAHRARKRVEKRLRELGWEGAW